MTEQEWLVSTDPAAMLRCFTERTMRAKMRLRPEPVSSVRVSLVDPDGDIVTETPLTEERWRQIARHG